MQSRHTPTRSGIAAVIAAVALGGGVFGVASAQRAEVPVQVPRGPGSFPVATPEAAANLNASDLLRHAPWLDQTHGSPSLSEVEALPSLRFPAGTSYDQAIDALYRSIVTTGTLPANAELGTPLPKAIVFADGKDEVQLSLTAPFGYDPGTGNILLPSLAFAPSMSEDAINDAFAKAREAKLAVPAGAKVVGNPLAPCQVMNPNGQVPRC